MSLSELIKKKRTLIFHTGMGSLIQSATGKDPRKECYANIVRSDPEVIAEIYSSLLESGCDIIETNTFLAQRDSLGNFGFKDQVREINIAAALLACKSRDCFKNRGSVLVSGTVGPTTKLPFRGEIGLPELKKIYIEQIEALVEGGVDIISIETGRDLLQIQEALKASHEVMRFNGLSLPVIVLFSPDKSGGLINGVSVSELIESVKSFEISALGVNCGDGFGSIDCALEQIYKFSPYPIALLPNAGKPEYRQGKWNYDITSEAYVHNIKKYLEKYPVMITGGCCGTTAEFMRKLSASLNLECK